MRKTLLLVLLVLSPVALYVVRLPERKALRTLEIPEELAFTDQNSQASVTLQPATSVTAKKLTKPVTKSSSDIKIDAAASTTATTAAFQETVKEKLDTVSTATLASKPPVSELSSTTTFQASRPPSSTERGTTTTAKTGEKRLIFSEEFDVFDPSLWKKEHSTYSEEEGELQCYMPEQVTINDGKLVLSAENLSSECPNGEFRKIASGMVRSQNIRFSPGQSIEYRVRLLPHDDSQQSGLRASFGSSGWNEGAESTEVAWKGFEVATARSPKRSIYSINFRDPAGERSEKTKEIWDEENFSKQWHTMRFDYGKDGQLTWYKDGEIVHQIAYQQTIQGWPAPFDQPITEFKLHLAVGGSAGDLDIESLPATYEIEYVRIYEL